MELGASYVAGADPELMLVDAQGGLTSAIGIVPGVKEAPHRLPGGGAVQRDNVMAEFNIEPANSAEEFEHNIRGVLRTLKDMVKPCRLAVRASADFPPQALAHPDAQVFGCDPDFNAWTISVNQIPPDAAFRPFRSAGGHFHFGYKEATRELLENPYGKMEVVKAADVFQGIVSILLDPDPTAPARRALYGGAGAHRPKDYGVEYRALGNFWVASPRLARLMYDLGEVAIQAVLSGHLAGIIAAIGGGRTVQDIINYSDTPQAKEVVEQHLYPFLPEKIKGQLVRDKYDLDKEWGI